MGYRLAPGERVIVAARPQAGSLVWPAVLFVLIPAACAFGAGWLTRNRFTFPSAVQQWFPAFVWTIAAVSVLLVLLYCLRPLLRWLGTRYVLTSRRLIKRRGLLRRREMQTPLVAVHQVEIRQSLFQRLRRCGDVVVDLGNGRAAVYVGVPEVHRFRDITLETIEDLPQTAMFDGVNYGYELDQARDSWNGTLPQ
ncbi:PH domain-containing protein [Arthrobacter castelli]|uniref:PH domain-containing protein n=1 Tax=Arthrobacter castelli TaxID=271431 RepID=UPI0004267D51|nr:PH domain-containing protein [Arthrobacter castelli]